MRGAVLKWGADIIAEVLDEIRPRVYSEPYHHIEARVSKMLIGRGINPTSVSVNSQYAATIRWNENAWREKLGT